MGSADPDYPDHNIYVLFLDLVRICSISIPYSAQDADTGCDDADHRCNRMECYHKMLLQFSNKFSDREGFCPDEMTKDLTPDSGLILGKV